LRFKVTATNEQGNAADDPEPSQNCFGGMSSHPTLKPGEKFVESLPLMRYCQIVQPGRYAIRATHDFGWLEGERKWPTGETTVTFRMPSPAEAEEVVARMEALPADPDRTFGRRSRDYADFSCLCQPIYLEPLMRRARNGNRNVLESITWMATPDATAGLIELSASSDRKLALDAAQDLDQRLPDPGLQATGGFGGFGPFTKDVRRHLVQRSWDAKFAPSVRALATNFLARSETGEMATGAFMVQAVGTTAEAAAVTSALGRALEPLVSPRRNPNDDILDQPEPVRELISAMGALHSRGYSLQEGSLNGEAEILLYFTWLAGQPPPRSDQWLKVVEAFGPNTRFPTRVAVLCSIPEPLPDSCVAFVQGRLADADLGVCRAACTIAGKSGNKVFLKPLLEIIATEHHEWLLREASDAARTLGAGYDLLDIWADRLSEEGLYALGLDSLQTVIEGLPGGWTGRTDLNRAERLELRDQWKSFLAKHADEIRAGKKFKTDDPALTPALFGRARTFQISNDKSWP
jgi:hypothetical protein